MAWWKKALLAVGVFLGLLVLFVFVVYKGGVHEEPGEVTKHARPGEVVEAQAGAQARTVERMKADKQVLFGDLHVHTTFSTDAFLMSLPLLGGEGAHPPADACDYARFCSGLDFYALTDHAEALTPEHYEESKASVRQCNAVAGGGDSPDMVAFMGWEWTQVGATPEEHYGHKNVIFPGIEDKELPARPIGSKGLASQAMAGRGIDLGTVLDFAAIPVRDFSRRQRYLNLGRMQREISAVENCPEGVDSRELPADCREIAETPGALFDKLNQWGGDVLVIPHGTTWGFYTPPGYSWDKQLTAAEDDPSKQSLIEVMSGHGNSEEYRPWQAAHRTKAGTYECPEASEGFEPCCRRAGELIRARCGDVAPDVCEARVKTAQARFLKLGVAGFRAISGVTVEDWGACDQCRDCFVPAYNYRPKGSAQYILARGNFDDPKKPKHARMGFIASSDNHKARPGTGYKEFARRKNTESTGPESEEWTDIVYGERGEKVPEALDIDPLALPPFRAVYAERQASFFTTGGLVAVHSEGRGRAAIWDALKRKEVYGTSGSRILLWFDLENSPDGKQVMGSEVQMGENPRFVIRAAGAFKQKPGCPDWVNKALEGDEVQRLCVGECYHPSDERHIITRIEVVRIRPQRSEDEPIDPLIQDAWKTLECPPDPLGCTVSFEDPDFVGGARDVVYYVRAIQEETPGVNAGNLRCEDKDCTKLKPCFGGVPTALDDDCLTKHGERAWSSPIFLRYDPSKAPAPEPVVPSDEAEQAP